MSQYPLAQSEARQRPDQKQFLSIIHPIVRDTSFNCNNLNGDWLFSREHSDNYTGVSNSHKVLVPYDTSYFDYAVRREIRIDRDGKNWTNRAITMYVTMTETGQVSTIILDSEITPGRIMRISLIAGIEEFGGSVVFGNENVRTNDEHPIDWMGREDLPQPLLFLGDFTQFQELNELMKTEWGTTVLDMNASQISQNGILHDNILLADLTLGVSNDLLRSTF